MKIEIPSNNFDKLYLTEKYNESNIRLVNLFQRLY